MKIQVWATNKYGEGNVQNLGVFEDVQDIQIKVGTFSDDVVIDFEEFIETN